MRDKERIRKFLDELEVEWSKVPDWRFGQLIINVFGTSKKDPWFYEEKEMIELFQNYFKRSE